MTRLIVSLDVPSATEAVRVARGIGSLGGAVRVGPRLLAKVGPAVITTLAPEADVFADARICGSVAETGAAVRALAGFGARWITVSGAAGAPALEGATGAAISYGAVVVATTVPPESPDPPGGRGKAVSSVLFGLQEVASFAVLGVIADIGVVVQVRSGAEVIVLTPAEPAAVLEAAERGAGAVIVDGGVARLPDPVSAFRALRESIASA